MRWSPLPTLSCSMKWSLLHPTGPWWGRTTWRWWTCTSTPASRSRWHAARVWSDCGPGGWRWTATCDAPPCCWPGMCGRHARNCAALLGLNNNDKTKYFTMPANVLSTDKTLIQFWQHCSPVIGCISYHQISQSNEPFASQLYRCAPRREGGSLTLQVECSKNK